MFSPSSITDPHFVLGLRPPPRRPIQPTPPVEARSPEHRVAELPAAVPALRAVHAGVHGGGGFGDDLLGGHGVQELFLPHLLAVS